MTTKKCWACETTTPYEQGWCPACWEEIPTDIQQAVLVAVTEPFAGRIRLSVNDMLAAVRFKHKPKLKLDDLIV